MTQKEISEKTKLGGGGLTTILKNLVKCDFCLESTIIGNKKKGSFFRLVDFYTLFYFQFVEHNKTNYEAFWTHNLLSPKISSWQGISFEFICLTHPQPNPKSSWYSRHCDISFVVKKNIIREC